MSVENNPVIHISGGTDEQRVQLRNLLAGLISDAQGVRSRIGFLNLAGLFDKSTLALQNTGLTIDMQVLSSEYKVEKTVPVKEGPLIVKVILFGETLYLGHDSLVGSVRTARQFDRLIEVSNEHKEINRLIVAYLHGSIPHVEDIPEGAVGSIEIWTGVGEFGAKQLASHRVDIKSIITEE